MQYRQWAYSENPVPHFALHFLAGAAREGHPAGGNYFVQLGNYKSSMAFCFVPPGTFFFPLPLSLVRAHQLLICLCSISCPMFLHSNYIDRAWHSPFLLLHGLDVQNQERNFCLDPTYFSGVGRRDTQWP